MQSTDERGDGGLCGGGGGGDGEGIEEELTWWLTPVIPATQEGEIRRIVIPGQPRQIVPEILS
jgi:hypothetical protein